MTELFAELACVPRLPGALCAGESDLFDPSTPDDDATDTTERIAFAAKLCRRCPELTPCRSWLNSLPPHQRPGGVVAGLLEGKEPPPMTDDSYPPEWGDMPPPDPLDPRLGRVLDPIQPTAAERALVAELAHQYVARDHGFAETFEYLCADRDTDERWPSVFVALLEQFAITALGAQGEQLSVARAESDLAAARDDIIEFGSHS